MIVTKDRPRYEWSGSSYLVQVPDKAGNCQNETGRALRGTLLTAVALGKGRQSIYRAFASARFDLAQAHSAFTYKAGRGSRDGREVEPLAFMRS
jgi:hypothetical protein